MLKFFTIFKEITTLAGFLGKMLPHTSRLLTVSTAEKLSGQRVLRAQHSWHMQEEHTRTLRAFGRLPLLITLCSVQQIVVMSRLTRKSLRNFKIILKVVLGACNPSTQEAKAGRSRAQDQSGQYCNFKVRLNYPRLHLKRNYCKDIVCYMVWRMIYNRYILVLSLLIIEQAGLKE